MRDQAFDSLALSLVPGLGRSQLHRILDRVESPSRILQMTRAELSRLKLPFEAQAFITTGCARESARETIELAAEKDFGILSLFDENYPELLRRIYQPPVILYFQGDSDLLRSHGVALVGSRRASVYGREVTMKLARELASAGLVIFSGLARGIDSLAHQGCLDVEGKTVAVLGTGIDVVYPKENRRLFARIGSRGCLVTEFPYGQYPAPQNFPIRNRIISGLALGTVIAEAGEFSGSLITARLTLEQDRDLWAVPGNITSPGSYGPNYLIKQGAAPVLTAQDVIDDLPPHVLHELSESGPAGGVASTTLEIDESQVLDHLEPDRGIHFDRLVSKTGRTASDLNRILFQLEMKGRVRTAPGRLYSRKLL